MQFLWRLRNASFDSGYASSPGWLLEEFQDFLRDWVESTPEVDSHPALLRSGRAHRRQRQWHVLCWVLLVLTHLVLCSRRLLSHGMEKHAQSMLRLPSSFFLGNLDSFSLRPLYPADIFSSQDLREWIFLSPRALTLVSARWCRGRREFHSGANWSE